MKSQEDFGKVMDFIYEIDGLKRIFRMTKILNEDRHENDAEHSWHICMMALTLRDFFDPSFGEIDTARAVKMLLLHDVVELYAGDTYCYDAAAAKDKYEREMASAKKIFGLLPQEIGDEFHRLWLEFDEEKTADARFAAIMDKLQPFLLNFRNNGQSWLDNGIKKSQIENRMCLVLDSAPPPIVDYVKGLIAQAAENGWIVID